MLSPHEIRHVCQAGKDRDPRWYRIHRRLSIHITAFLLQTPVTLNQVSLLMMFMAALGAALMTSANLWVNAGAGVCLYLSFLLDKVDGEMARYRKQESVMGILLDRFHHRLVEPLLFLGVGWRAFQATGSLTPLFAALATMLAANIIEETQQLPAFIAAKFARETGRWPVPETAGPSLGLERAAGVMRALKTFRMFITVLPLVLVAIAAESLTGQPVTTWLLLTSAGALWVYVLFQAWYYAHGQLDADLATLTVQLPPLPVADETEAPAVLPTNPPTLSVVSAKARGDEPPRRSGHAGVTTLALLALCGLAAGPAAAATYYVDNSTAACSNNGAGTEAQPYCTITAALAARGVAGNTILVKPGNYPEQVTLPASGNSANPLVVRAIGGVVTVDGADDFSATNKWVNTSGNIWRASTVTWSPKQVFANGARLVASTASVTSLPVGTFRYVSNQGLYVNVGGANPGTQQTRVGRRNYAFVLSGRSWITLEGFTATRTEDRAFYLSNGSNDVQLIGNTVTFSNKYGIYLSECLRARVASSVVTDNNHHGIMLTTGTSQCLVEDNESARNAVPGTRAANGLYVYGSANNTLRRNRWHDNQDTGQHLQSGSNNNLSYNNISWNNGDHGYDHLGATGTYHTNDIAYGNFKDGFSIEGNATGTSVFNCIAVDNGLTTNEFNLWVEGSSQAGFASNDNIFWNSTSQAPIKYGTTIYPLLSAYVAASGRDSRSLQQDPRFVNSSSGNFHLIPGSPAIDNGNSSVANWPATDAEGNARTDDPGSANTGLGPVDYADRGSLEFQPTGLAPLAVLVADPAVATAPAEITLDASGSSDPDGSIVSYEFDFGDGVSAAPQAGPIATHTYTAGTYNAIVTIMDDIGLTARDTVVVVSNAAPIAVLNATPTSGKAPLTVNVNASGSTDANGTVVSYRFDFGDGIVVGPQPGATASHVFGTGTWSVRLTISDNHGAQDTLNTAIVVTVGPPNVSPTAALNVSPGSGQAPLGVTADASGSSDSDGGIASYRFDFGGGTVVGPQPGATAPHVFGVGTHVVTVLVTDTDGATASASDTVVVTPPAPDQPPVVTAAATISVLEGGALSLPVTASDPDGQALTSLTADLSQLPAGHNATFTPSPDFTSGTLTWNPTFADSGTYSVTFTASNALSAQAATQVHVGNVDRAPVISGPAVVTGLEGQLISFALTVADADGDAIATLTADLAALPAGNDAVFTPGPGNASATISWTPLAGDTGIFDITFEAGNALAGNLVTSVRIGFVDTAPVVVAPATAEVLENSALSLAVTASDVDADAITSLTADLSGLPAGNTATFTPGPGNLGGTLAWTPGFSDSGTYTVRFFAANLLADTATTVLHVGNLDRAPVVTAPANASGFAGTNITFTVTAVDPDGDAITSLAANLSELPANHTATFTLSGGAASGQFAWTPAVGEAGGYDLTFTGSNALSGQAITHLTVLPPNQAPTSSMSVTPVTGNAPLSVTVDGSASSDPEGAALSYRFDFGDGTILGPQASAVAAHVYAAGVWTVQLTVTDPLGAVNTSSASITVAATGPGANLVTNPSFESGSTGWNSYSGGVLLRVAGGFDGNWAVQVTGPATTSNFGINDSPNWVANAGAIGTRYRFSAWVRSVSSTGTAKLQIREYQGGTKIGASTLSALVPLSPEWQFVTVDRVVEAVGTTLDFQVIDSPTFPNDVFLVDNISIHVIPAAGPAAIMAGADEHLLSGPALQFGAWVSPTVARTDATLSFVTTRPGAVRVDLFDASGRLVKGLMDDANVAPGLHKLNVDGRSDRGDRLGSGMYFYRVQAAERSAVGRLVFVR